jgi:hypothetical protein
MLLFCVASNTDWKHTAIPGEIVTTMVVKGLIERDAAGQLALTECGGAVLRACCRTYDGLVSLYPNNRLPASVGPTARLGQNLTSAMHQGASTFHAVKPRDIVVSLSLQ